MGCRPQARRRFSRLLPLVAAAGRAKGENAKGFSANVIVPLKEQWSQVSENWNRRYLKGEQYFYFWSDGIYANVRLEDEANNRQCMLLVMDAHFSPRHRRLANSARRKEFDRSRGLLEAAAHHQA